MHTDTATGPAWQVREAQRQQFLEAIHQKIIKMEAEIESAKLHHFLLYEFQQRLRNPGKALFPNGTILIIPGWPRQHIAMAKEFFLQIEKSIKEFQRSIEEGNTLLAKLLEWTASEIARPYHSALQQQEVHEPKLIYGVESATDEVPFV